MTAQPYQVTVTDKTNPDGQRVIRTGLSEYNREMAGYADARGLSVFVSDPETKKIIGGLLGRIECRPPGYTRLCMIKAL